MAATEEKAFTVPRRIVPHLKTRARLFVRHNIRNSELGLIAVAAIMGAVIALGVALTRELVDEIHHLLFGVPIDEHLSGTLMIEPWRRAGGAVRSAGSATALIAYALWRWRPRDIVDAIEANALHGGRMSLSDSLRLTGLTVLSAGVGASVGLEAAFTQLGSGIASRIGRLSASAARRSAHLCRLRRRRGDRRRVQRAARRRVLRLRADHRQLHAGDAGRRSSSPRSSRRS